MSKHQFANVSIDWLSDVTTEKTVFEPALNIQQVVYPLPPEVGEAKGEMICTRDGISLYFARHRYIKNPIERFLRLGEIQVDFQEESLYIETETATVIHHDQIPETRFEIHAGEAAFYHTRAIRFIPHHDTHHPFRTLAIGLPISQLQEMIGDANVARFLEALSIQHAPAVNVAPFLPSFSRLLEDAFSTQLTGKMREIQIQARVLEFFCLVIQHYTQQPDTCSVATEKRAAVQQLHDQLLCLNGKLPTLSELARQTGLSQGELNKLYIDEHGLSVHRFIQRQRLIEAHESIQTTTMPLKRLADRLGYSNVTHFNTAFKKQFGYPPGSLRKNRRS